MVANNGRFILAKLFILRSALNLKCNVQVCGKHKRAASLRLLKYFFYKFKIRIKASNYTLKSKGHENRKTERDIYFHYLLLNCICQCCSHMNFELNKPIKWPYFDFSIKYGKIKISTSSFSRAPECFSPKILLPSN